MMDIEANQRDATLDQIRACCQVLDAKKAEDIKILCVRGISSITDYFVLATGNSDPHLRALGKYVNEALQPFDLDTLTTNPNDRSGWTVVDAYDFIVHIFTKEIRDRYNLEGLWKDAELISVEEFVPAIAVNS